MSGEYYKYYERTITLQKNRIESQRLELGRMKKVYLREVRNTSIGDAFKFLIQVIFEKITNKIKK